MNRQLRIAGIIKESIVDGPGIRLVVFTQGCRHHCPGCHNPNSHSFEGGTLVDISFVLQQITSNPLLDGVTLSGGEPFEQAEILAELAREIKNLGLNIMTYTGYKFEYLLAHSDTHPGWAELLDQTDILVDGRFDMEKKNLLLRFRGSENQRIIDVRKSLLDSEPALLDW